MNTLGRILGALGVITLTSLCSLACMAPVDPEPQDIVASGADDASGDENVSQVSEAVGTCHGTVTCPNPKSCAAWSDYYTCGTSCFADRGCGGCGTIHDDPGCIPDGTKGLRNRYEQFRTCTLQDNSKCTEYSGYTGGVVSCGCTP